MSDTSGPFGPLLDTRLRVLTSNLWWQFGPWEARRPAIAPTIGACHADVIALQEVWGDATGASFPAECAPRRGRRSQGRTRFRRGPYADRAALGTRAEAGLPRRLGGGRRGGRPHVVQPKPLRGQRPRTRSSYRLRDGRLAKGGWRRPSNCLSGGGCPSWPGGSVPWPKPGALPI